MSGIVACPSCGTRNRVPSIASGTPVCASCKASLPWLVEATSAADLDAVLHATVPVIVDLWAPGADRVARSLPSWSRSRGSAPGT